MTPSTHITRCITVAATLAAGLTACGGSGGGTSPLDAVLKAQRTPGSALTLKTATSCAAWRDYAARSFVEQAISPVYAVGFGTGEDVAAAPTAGADANAPRFTDTNTQEAGVDEADLLETDSDRGLLYVVHRATNSVRIIDAVPAADTREIGRIDLPGDGYVIGLYLDTDNQRLTTVVGTSEGTWLDFHDVSDSATPSLLDSYRVDGYYLASRGIGTRIHLIASHFFTGLNDLYTQSEFTSAVNAWFQAQSEGDTDRADRIKDDLIDLADAAADSATLASLLPNTAAGTDAALQPVPCEAMHHPDVATAMATLSISSVDNDGSDAAAIGTVNNAWMVYASADNLYLAQTSNGWFFAPFQVDQTAVYRYAISDTGPAQPKGAGVADGWLLNRYAMSEHAGHLRLATSREDTCQSVNPEQPCPDTAPVRTNDVTVLRLDDTALTQVGRVTDFGNDERIFSARFVGDVGYVVTFEQIDPLFTFDLSDPTNPTLLGEVEIPGFSTYIQPITTDRLLTIGRVGGEGGVGTGNAFQLQLFDVSDLRNPTRIAATVPAIEPDDWAFSVAEYEPLAFTYAPASATTGLLSIPAQIGSPSESRAFSGFITWDIDTAGTITEDLRIDHKQTDGGDPCPPNGETGQADCASFAPIRYNTPLRSAIAMGSGATTVYTLSDAFLVVTDADSGANLATLTLN